MHTFFGRVLRTTVTIAGVMILMSASIWLAFSGSPAPGAGTGMDALTSGNVALAFARDGATTEAVTEPAAGVGTVAMVAIWMMVPVLMFGAAGLWRARAAHRIDTRFTDPAITWQTQTPNVSVLRLVPNPDRTHDRSRERHHGRIRAAIHTATLGH